MENFQKDLPPRGIFSVEEDSQDREIPTSSWFAAFYNRKYEREREEEQLFYPYRTSTCSVIENIRGMRCIETVPEFLVERKMMDSVPQDLQWLKPIELHPSTMWVEQLQYFTVSNDRIIINRMYETISYSTNLISNVICNRVRNILQK